MTGHWQCLILDHDRTNWSRSFPGSRDLRIIVFAHLSRSGLYLAGVAVGWRASFAFYGALGLLWAVWFSCWYRDDPAEHPAVSAEERAWIKSWRGKAPGPLHDVAAPWGRILTNRSVISLSFATFWSAF